MSEIERIERRISLHDLRVLISVIESGSMGKAAERLATSQPAVSRSIADLEQALGVRLLDRSPQGVEPTPYGMALVHRGVAAFDELRQGVKDIEFLADPTAGELRIGASVSVAAGLVSAVIDRLSRKYPRLSFQVLAVGTTAACCALIERKVDLVMGHLVEVAAEEQLSTEVLYREPLVVAAGVQSPWAKRRRLVLADLMNEPWTLPPPDTPFGFLVSEAFRASGLNVPRTTVVSSLPVRNALLATGRFLTMIPSVLLAFSAKYAALKSLPINVPTRDLAIGVITLKNRTLHPVANLFINSAREAAKDLSKNR